MLESGSWGHSVLQTPALVFFYFSQKTGFDTSCKLSICMKCQILFSGINKKNISLLSAENAQRVVKVNMIMYVLGTH